MRAAPPVLLILVLLAGCGGDDEPSRSAAETAHEWVDAVNSEDYDRACELSVFDKKSACLELMKDKPFGNGLKVEGFYFNKSEGAGGEATFAISSAKDRKPRGTGWTAYAPTDGFRIERQSDDYRVRFDAPTRPPSEAPARRAGVSVTLSPSEGGRHDQFAAEMVPPHTTGIRGKTRTSYVLAAHAIHPDSGCVNNRDSRFPDAAADTRVTATLDPARGEGGELGWCRGRFRGTVTYFMGYACPPEGRCSVPPGFPRRTEVVGRFSFRVR